MTQDVAIAAPGAAGEGDQPQEFKFEEERTRQVDGVDRGKIMDILSRHLEGEVSQEGLKAFADQVIDPQVIIDFYAEMEEKNRHQLTDLESLRARLLKIEENLQPQMVNGAPSYKLKERLERCVYLLIGNQEKARAIDTISRRRMTEKVSKEKAEALSKECVGARTELGRLDEIIAKEEKGLVDLSASVSGAKAQMVAYHGSVDQLNRDRDEAYAKIRESCDAGNYKEAARMKDTVKRIENDIRLFAQQEQSLANTIHVNGRTFFALRGRAVNLREVRALYQGVTNGFDLSSKEAQKDAEGGVYLNVDELVGKIDTVRKLHEDQEMRWKRQVEQMGALQRGSPSVTVFTPQSPMLDRMKKSTANLSDKMRLGTNDLYTNSLSIADEVEAQRPYI